MTYEEAEKLALRAIHDTDGRGLIGRSRLHLHQRVARAILAARTSDANAAEDRRWIDAVEANGIVLIRALQTYGFPVSDVASTADMSVEARNLHNAARRFIVAFNSTGSTADEPAVTNGQ